MKEPQMQDTDKDINSIKKIDPLLLVIDGAVIIIPHISKLTKSTTQNRVKDDIRYNLLIYCGSDITYIEHKTREKLIENTDYVLQQILNYYNNKTN